MLSSVCACICASLYLVSFARYVNGSKIPLLRYNKHVENDHEMYYASESKMVTISYPITDSGINPLYHTSVADNNKNRHYRDNYKRPPKKYKDSRNAYYFDEQELPETSENKHSGKSKSVDGASACRQHQFKRVIRQIGDQLSVEFGNDHQPPQWEKKRKIRVPQPWHRGGGGGEAVVKSRDIYGEYYNDDDDYYVPPGPAYQRKAMMSPAAIPRYTGSAAIETTTDEDEEWNRWFMLARTSNRTPSTYSPFKCLIWTSIHLQIYIFKI